MTPVSTRPLLLNIGDKVYREDDIFFYNGRQHRYKGTRGTVFEIIAPAKNGDVMVKIVQSAGMQPYPSGVTIPYPLANLYKGFMYESTNQVILKAGGHIEGYENGKKVVLGTAEKGGMSVGATHAEGGIKGTVGQGGRDIEFENKEPILVPAVSDDTRLYSLNGKKLTAKEVASEINVVNNGVPIAEKGMDVGTEANPIEVPAKSIILTAPVSTDNRIWEFEGKEMTSLEIASELNKNNGGLAFAQGGATCGC